MVLFSGGKFVHFFVHIFRGKKWVAQLIRSTVFLRMLLIMSNRLELTFFNYQIIDVPDVFIGFEDF